MLDLFMDIYFIEVWVKPGGDRETIRGYRYDGAIPSHNKVGIYRSGYTRYYSEMSDGDLYYVDINFKNGDDMYYTLRELLVNVIRDEKIGQMIN